MTGGADALLVVGVLAVIAAAVIVAVKSRHGLTRVSERHGERRVLRATPVHQRHAERPPAAISAGRVYEITDLPGRRARDSERSQ